MGKTISIRSNKQSKIFAAVDFIITLLIIWIADNPIVIANREFKLLVFGIILLVFVYRKRRFDFQIVAVIISVFLIVLLQGYRWGISYFTLVTYVVFSVLTPYFAIKVLGVKYLKITSLIVYYSAILSLVMFLGQAFIPGFTSSLYSIESFFHPFSSVPERPSILIYSIAINTVDQAGMTDFLRNSGMFHEAGAFAVFIVLSIVINIMIDDRPFSKKNIVLLIALVTTFSTAGYISVVLVYFFYFYFTKKKNIRVLLLATIVFVPLMIYIAQLPFMVSKIEEQVTNETTSSLNAPTSGRILGARKALVVLMRYPITGRGIISASRETDFTSDEMAGYGFMRFFSQIGVLLSIAFLLFFIKGMKRISFYLSGIKAPWLMMGTGLLISLFSQKFISDSFFIMFFFIGFLKEYSFKNIFRLRNLH